MIPSESASSTSSSTASVSLPVASLGLLLSLVASLPLSAQRLPEIREIEGDKVHELLPPDAIPSIDKPRFGGADARYMRNEEPVIGVVRGGVAKAYSIWHLDRHEIVNDRIGDDPIAVTW